MKRILGVVFYLLAGVIAIFVTLLLLLQTLTAIGLAKSNSKEPGLLVASFFFLFGAMLTIFLIRLGRNISQSRGGFSLGAKINLLFVGLIVDVVVFLKSAVPYLTRGHGGLAGSVALLSALMFAILCWLLVRVWRGYL
ncbi:MAG TPA: hypothetical protein DC054_01965 [Blastocatellia bacterium]|nr:hypothetical protein [Blastocatellia bacterium]